MQTTNLATQVPDLILPANAKVDPALEFAAQLGVSQQISELISATRIIFAGNVWVEVDEDPEIVDCSYLVFHVKHAGSAVENSRRRREWYKVTRELLREHLDKLRLTIDS